MQRKRDIHRWWGAKLLSLVLPFLILNLCVFIPVPQADTDPQNGVSDSGKRDKKFLLELAVEFITDDDAGLPDGASSALLEELLEEEGWNHQVTESRIFHEFYIRQEFHAYVHPIFILLEDKRFSPPPEFLA